MSCFKALAVSIAAISAPVLAIADDQALDEILKASKDIVKSAAELAEEEASELKAIQPAQVDDGEWIKGKELQEHGGSDRVEETAQQRAWTEVMQGMDAGKRGTAQGPPRPTVPHDVMYVYISLSMPAEAIRNLFLQALDNKKLRSTIFVIRGWNPPGINHLVSELNALFPDAKKLRDLPNVQINPKLYEQQSIQTVPTFSTKDRKGRWGTVVGSTSIEDAVRRIESNRYDGEVIGPTYEIEEPDILKLIKQRIAKVDWNSQVEQAKEGLLTKRTSGRPLPYATSDSSYLVDLTVLNNRDLTGTRGEVFASAGTSINPFDYLSTRRRYVFFDANSDEQVERAAQWRETFEYSTFITTVPARTEARRKAVIQRIERPVYEVNDLLIKRFNIRAVPSVAYQEGKMLRVDVFQTSEPDVLKSNALAGEGK